MDETAADSELLDRAITMAGELAGKDPATLGAIKKGMYGSIVTALLP